MRLNRALADVYPETAAQFFALASLQIRRALVDLSRKHFGPRGLGQNYGSIAGTDGENRCEGVAPAADRDLDDWVRFHEAVQALSEKSLAVVNLLFSQGLSQADAGATLGVTVRTVKRRWRSARQELHAALDGKWPAE